MTISIQFIERNNEIKKEKQLENEIMILQEQLDSTPSLEQKEIFLSKQSKLELIREPKN